MKRIAASQTTTRWRGLAAAVVLLAACGGDGTSASTRTPTTGASDTTAVTTTMESTVPATEPSTTQATMPTTTVAELLDHLQLDFEGCTQFSTNTGVSLEAAAPYVPDTATVFVSDLGEARVALITKTCDALIVDGVDFGPGHFNTIWLRITGPEDVRMVPDATDELSAVPDHFVPLAFHSDNELFVEAVRKVGVPMELATIESDPPAAGTQTGSVVTTLNGDPLAYHWSVENGQEVPQHLAVVHVLHGADAGGRAMTYDIECVLDFGWFLNPATVEFDQPGALAGLIGTGWSSNGFGPALQCHILIDRG